MSDSITIQIPTVNAAKTGENIERLRLAAGLSVADLQKIFDFTTPQAIYKWQRGTSMPTIANLAILAAVLDVNMDDIIAVDCGAKVKVPIHKSKLVATAMSGAGNSEC